MIAAISCPCPISCPVLSKKSTSFSIDYRKGEFVSSPLGTYYDEILSESIERKYLDFKGLWEECFLKDLQNEIENYDWELARLIESWLFEFRSGSKIKVPSAARISYTWLLMAYLQAGVKISLIFDQSFQFCPSWEMPHLSENIFSRAGAIQSQVKPTSYLVRTWWKNADGRWSSGKIYEKTFRFHSSTKRYLT